MDQEQFANKQLMLNSLNQKYNDFIQSISTFPMEKDCCFNGAKSLKEGLLWLREGILLSPVQTVHVPVEAPEDAPAPEVPPVEPSEPIPAS